MAAEFPPPLDNIIYCSSSSQGHTLSISIPPLLCSSFRWPPHLTLTLISILTMSFLGNTPRLSRGPHAPRRSVAAETGRRRWWWRAPSTRTSSWGTSVRGTLFQRNWRARSERRCWDSAAPNTKSSSPISLLSLSRSRTVLPFPLCNPPSQNRTLRRSSER